MKYSIFPNSNDDAADDGRISEHDSLSCAMIAVSELLVVRSDVNGFDIVDSGTGDTLVTVTRHFLVK